MSPRRVGVTRRPRSHLLAPRAEPAAEPSQVDVGDLDHAHVRVGLEDRFLDGREWRAVRQLHASPGGRLSDGLAGLGDGDNDGVVAHHLGHVRVVEERVLSELDALHVPPHCVVQRVHRAAEGQLHVLQHRHAAAREEVPVTVAVAPELRQHHDRAIDRA